MNDIVLALVIAIPIMIALLLILSILRILSRADDRTEILIAREAMNRIICESAEDENPEHDWSEAVQKAIAFYRDMFKQQ